MSVEPVAVYCCLRPLPSNETEPCCRAVSDNTVLMVPPTCSFAFKSGVPKESRHIFKRVFGENVTQKALFMETCIPLVTDFLLGKNALLFTYGVSGSGKTYSMTGSSQDPGLLPRTVDVIFNSISPYLAKKYTVKLNSFNEFVLLSDADKMLERQKKELLPGLQARCPTTPKSKKADGDIIVKRLKDESKIFCVDENCVYSIFVSYVEIYNKYIYDLLDDTAATQPQTKILREDNLGRAFIKDAVEIEVRSADEAYNLFMKGSQRRHKGTTQLNICSSRSHGVFTIRLVRLSPEVNEGLQTNCDACVSQFSLVDLAGTERIMRTNTDGNRLKEANNINASLLTLRNCFEILRKNQKYGGSQIVPYRDSKLTLLFKHYFEGDGTIVMLLCVNPSASDYDENVHAMKFAEATQEVQSTVRAEKLVQLKTPRPVQEVQHLDRFENLKKTFRFSLPPENIEITSCFDENTIPALYAYLEQHVVQRERFNNLYNQQLDAFRQDLQNLLEDYGKLIDSQNMLRARNQQLERKLKSVEILNEESEKKYVRLEKEKTILEAKLEELTIEVKMAKKEKKLVVQDFEKRLRTQEIEYARKLQEELSRLDRQYNVQVSEKDEKIRLVKDILQKESVHQQPYYRTECFVTPAKFSQNGSSITTVTPLHSRRVRRSSDSSVGNSSGVPVASPRQLRRLSGEIWLDHRPKGTIDTDGVLQPRFGRRRRSVHKIDIIDTVKSSKYALTHQEQTNEGDLVTQVIKGDILPTVGGGANVIFTDVEKVKLVSPTLSVFRKRPCDQAESDSTDKSTKTISDETDSSNLFKKLKQ